MDYFAFTISVNDLSNWREGEIDNDTIIELIESKFMFQGLKFEEKRGFYGYKYSQWYNGITYCYGGYEHIYIQMSGSGCRTWETLHPDLSWESWISKLKATYPSLHVARLDIAFDCFGCLKLKTIINATRRSHYISKWKTYLINEGNREMAVIWGSAKSDCRFRIYDKTMERSKALGSDSEVPKDWVRLEFQFRNDMAAAFLREWLALQDLTVVYFGVLRQKLVYVSEFDGHNYDRATIYPWWNRLIKDHLPIKLACRVGVEYNLQHLERYVYQQAGSSIKTLLKAKDGDLSGFLANIEAKVINDRQQTLLDSLKAAKSDPVEPKKYQCFECGHVGTSEDFIFYGENSRCWCRACARRV